MKSKVLLVVIAAVVMVAGAAERVASPDGRLAVEVGVEDGEAYYSVAYDGARVLERSRLGLVADFGNLKSGLAIAGIHKNILKSI